MVRPLSMKERGEIIGLALDLDNETYNDYLDNEQCFKFMGNATDARVGAAIALVYYKAEQHDGKDYRAEHDDFYMSIWGRSILYETKHDNACLLKIFPNKKKARAEFNKPIA